MLGRCTRADWWRRPPFLPLPDPAYIQFRLETAYGVSGRPEPADLVAYLRWCRERDAIARRAPRDR
jgi:hypothetical protein